MQNTQAINQFAKDKRNTKANKVLSFGPSQPTQDPSFDQMQLKASSFSLLPFSLLHYLINPGAAQPPSYISHPSSFPLQDLGNGNGPVNGRFSEGTPNCCC